MYTLNRLNTSKKYLISNYPGYWHFQRVAGDFAMFYKFAHNNRRVSIKLTFEQIEQMVWERMTLSSTLEAFNE